VSETYPKESGDQPPRPADGGDDRTESESDAEGQRLAENEQERPRTVTQKVANAIEDMIPGDSDRDGH
jgi:hypothetical protein